jgi:hypothetical protein
MFNLTRSPSESTPTDSNPPALQAKLHAGGSEKSGMSNLLLGVKHRNYREFIVQMAKSAAREPPQAIR